MKPETAAPQQEVLAGLVERVTFHNIETGFCVLRIKARGHRDMVTVVGHAAIISAGEWVTATGEWVNDRTHGQQFKTRFMRTSALTSIDGIEKYLSSGMIRGIGPVYAKKLVKAFGEKVFDTIEANPERLKEIDGIGPVRALIDLQQIDGERHQFLGRQAAMTLVHGLGEGIGNPSADANHRRLLDAELHCNGVGGLEADAADVARQAIGVLGHDLDGVAAVGLEDPDSACSAHAVIATSGDRPSPDPRLSTAWQGLSECRSPTFYQTHSPRRWTTSCLRSSSDRRPVTRNWCGCG